MSSPHRIRLLSAGAALAVLLLASLGCGRFTKDPKREGAGMPIEITEEHPVDAPDTAEEETPPP